MPGLDLWPWVPGPGLGLNWHLALCHLGAGTCPRRAESTPRASSPTGLVERTFQAKHLGKGRLCGVMGSQHLCPPGNVLPGCSPAKMGAVTCSSSPSSASRPSSSPPPPWQALPLQPPPLQQSAEPSLPTSVPPTPGPLHTLFPVPGTLTQLRPTLPLAAPTRPAPSPPLSTARPSAILELALWRVN